jgi:hypothetical protein
MTTVLLSPNDFERLCNAADRGYLWTEDYTNEDTYSLYAEHCRRERLAAIVVAPSRYTPDAYNVSVDCSNMRSGPTLAQAKALEVSLRKYGDVYELVAEPSDSIQWGVTIPAEKRSELVVRILQALDMPVPTGGES